MGASDTAADADGTAAAGESKRRVSRRAKALTQRYAAIEKRIRGSLAQRVAVKDPFVLSLQRLTLEFALKHSYENGSIGIGGTTVGGGGADECNESLPGADHIDPAFLSDRGFDSTDEAWDLVDHAVASTEASTVRMSSTSMWSTEEYIGEGGQGEGQHGELGDQSCGFEEDAAEYAFAAAQQDALSPSGAAALARLAGPADSTITTTSTAAAAALARVVTDDIEADGFIDAEAASAAAAVGSSSDSGEEQAAAAAAPAARDDDEVRLVHQYHDDWNGTNLPALLVFVPDSFHRLLTHGLCQFAHLTSSSEELKGLRRAGLLTGAGLKDLAQANGFRDAKASPMFTDKVVVVTPSGLAAANASVVPQTTGGVDESSAGRRRQALRDAPMALSECLDYRQLQKERKAARLKEAGGRPSRSKSALRYPEAPDGALPPALQDMVNAERSRRRGGGRKKSRTTAAGAVRQEACSNAQDKSSAVAAAAFARAQAAAAAAARAEVNSVAAGRPVAVAASPTVRFAFPAVNAMQQ